MSKTLWIDVEDVFEYAQANPRPSGIQRLAFEIYKALQARPDAAEFVRFVRHDDPRNSFRVVQWSEVEALFAGLTDSELEPEPAQPPPGVILPHPPLRQFIRKLVYRLPPSLRAHVIEVMLTQYSALRAWVRLFDALARGVIIRLMKPFRLVRSQNRNAFSSDSAPNAFSSDSAPGDILLVLGAPWWFPDYATRIKTQQRRGLHFALLIYDLIPLHHPEWCEPPLIRVFREYCDSVLPLCEQVFAISKATAADVERYTREHGIMLPRPVVPIPIGTSFGVSNTPVPASRSQRLPIPGSYALIVSTIAARKNHILLFRVWQRMLEERPHDSIPTLVFAGRVGWLVDDLMRQIANTDNLNGKLLLIENPTDAELLALYEGCLFTLFPSFFEGWGLPVTESLALGKPCLTSDRTSLPEAGGTLTRKFDPDNLHDAYHAILEVIEDRPGLARWEAQVRREFKPVSWSTTAEVLLTTLGYSRHN